MYFHHQVINSNCVDLAGWYFGVTTKVKMWQIAVNGKQKSSIPMNLLTEETNPILGHPTQKFNVSLTQLGSVTPVKS